MKEAALRLAKSERSKIAYVLIAILLLSLSYPLSELGRVAAIGYVFLYLVLLGSGIYLVSENRFLFITSIVLTLIISISGVTTILLDLSTPLWVRLTWGMSLIAYQSLIIAMLVIFIIESETVTVEVLFAAVAIYFLLAATFSIIYGAMETISPGSFISASGADMTWQRLAYFSFVTITTLGYGDIVPIAPAAQSISAFEASIGTLYIAILVGRFVSLFQRGQP